MFHETTITTFDGINLYFRKDEPASTPQATIVIVHGLCEYAGRYDYVTENYLIRILSSIASTTEVMAVVKGSAFFIKISTILSRMCARSSTKQNQKTRHSRYSLLVIVWVALPQPPMAQNILVR